MWGIRAVLLMSMAAFCASFDAQGHDRTASIGDSRESAEADNSSDDGKLVEIIHAMDRQTHSSTKIVQRPFPRSLKETAAGYADFHIPFIDDGVSPPPPGLSYVKEADFGTVFFVIYSRKADGFDVNSVAGARLVESEPGHGAFFSFPVGETHCVSCSLDKIVQGRLDALIVSEDIVDPLLHDAKYKGIHRALYAGYLVRALVPVDGDTLETRRYLIEGSEAVKRSGELWTIAPHNFVYSDWQP